MSDIVECACVTIIDITKGTRSDVFIGAAVELNIVGITNVTAFSNSLDIQYNWGYFQFFFNSNFYLGPLVFIPG